MIKFINDKDFISHKINIKPENKGYAIKANISVEGSNTHCGSLLLKDYISPFDATVVTKLRKNNYFPNMVTHMDEFAMGGIGKSLMHGITLNPWNKNLIVGGSSSGSAVAALRGSEFALGSTTGGSVRLPSAFCGIIGFEPSYGAISRYGLVSFASSLDKIGIMSRSLQKVEEIFDVIKGKDFHDMTSINIKDTLMYKSDIHKSKLKIGILTDLTARNTCDFHVYDIYRDFTFNLNKDKDINISFIDQDIITMLNLCNKDYFIISSVEAMSNLRRFNGIRFMNIEGETFEQKFSNSIMLMGEEVRRRLYFAQLSLVEEPEIYFGAIKRRIKIMNYFNDIFNDFDAIILPTVPCSELKLEDINDVQKVTRCDLFLSFTNLIHGCSITLPIEQSSRTAIQIVSSKGRDKLILDIAKRIQMNINYDEIDKIQ